MMSKRQKTDVIVTNNGQLVSFIIYSGVTIHLIDQCGYDNL